MSCRMKRYDNSFKRKVQKKRTKNLPAFMSVSVDIMSFFFRNVGKCCFPFRFRSSMLFLSHAMEVSGIQYCYFVIHKGLKVI